MGTTSAVRAVVAGDLPRIPAGLWCYRVDREHSLPGGAMTEGGNVFAWMCDTLQLPPLEDLEPSLASAAPDMHGLTMLPFLAGERSPGWAGHARAAIDGLSLATTPLSILQAGMESVAYRVGMVFDLLQPLLPEDFEVVVSGGALLSSPAWRQIVADVLNRPVTVSEVREASARGAALLTLRALGVLDDVGQAPPFVGASVEPDAGRHARYAEAMERQQLLYEKLIAAVP
jgi:gluconokinase